MNCRIDISVCRGDLGACFWSDRCFAHAVLILIHQMEFESQSGLRLEEAFFLSPFRFLAPLGLVLFVDGDIRLLLL